MITLDNQSGEFCLDELRISCGDNFKKISETVLLENLELWTSNVPWVSYRYTANMDYIVVIFFYEDVIKYIDIYPNRVKDSRAFLYNSLKKLGGESKYFWGKVELNNDKKAGYTSIVITYN